MTDLRALLGAKYDETIEKASRAIDGDTADYLGCGCCASYDYFAAVKRTGHRVRAYMAAHDALAAVLPDLLAAAWDEGCLAGDTAAFNGHINGHPVNPYRRNSERAEAGA